MAFTLFIQLYTTTNNIPRTISCNCGILIPAEMEQTGRMWFSSEVDTMYLEDSCEIFYDTRSFGSAWT